MKRKREVLKQNEITNLAAIRAGAPLTPPPGAAGAQALSAAWVMGRPALALLAALLLPLRAEVLQWGREVTYKNLGEASDAVALRTMLANVKGFAPVEIQLASGEHKIRATLLVHHTWVKIVGNGAGATLDGQGTTRLFDVKGGTLELEGVSLTRGGDVADGAAVQVRRGGRFNLTNGNISESHAVPPVDVSGRETHSARAGAVAAWEPPDYAELDRLDALEAHMRTAGVARCLDAVPLLLRRTTMRTMMMRMT